MHRDVLMEKGLLIRSCYRFLRFGARYHDCRLHSFMRSFFLLIGEYKSFSSVCGIFEGAFNRMTELNSILEVSSCYLVGS